MDERVPKGRYANAALVPLEESDLESLELSDNAALNQILIEAEERIQKTGGIKHDDFWRSLEE